MAPGTQAMEKNLEFFSKVIFGWRGWHDWFLTSHRTWAAAVGGLAVRSSYFRSPTKLKKRECGRLSFLSFFIPFLII